MLAARARPERVAALLLIAPAPDFTERLMWPSFSPAQQRQLISEGRLELSSAYSPDPTVITRAMIEDGRLQQVMSAPIVFAGPVEILAGGEDPDVPLSHVKSLVDVLPGAATRLHVIADGDHRLSRPQDLERLVTLADELRSKLAC